MPRNDSGAGSGSPLRLSKSAAALPILIIDDQPADLEILVDILFEGGFENVVAAAGGAEGIAVLVDPATTGELPSVVVVDIRMPSPDGYEVLARMKAMEPNSRPLALAVTADASQATRIAALQAGAADFITKPFDPVELLLRVGNLAEMKWQQRELQRRAVQYQLLAEYAADVVLHVDSGGRVDWVSDSIRGSLGWEPAGLLGKAIRDLVHPEDFGPAQEHHRRLESNGVGSGPQSRAPLKARLRHVDGSWVWNAIEMSPLEGGASICSMRVADAEVAAAARAALQEALGKMATLKYRSSRDALTGLANRSETMAVLDAALAQSGGESVAVLYIDVDRFRDVNVSRSHEVGDKLLAFVAQHLADAVRQQDRMGRIGGDEFVAVLNSVPDESSATRIAEALRRQIEEARFEDGGSRIAVTVSIGVAMSNVGSTAGSLLSDADAALSMAKTTGRNRWVLAQANLSAVQAGRLELAAQIRAGIEAGQFHAWFQPIVDLKTGELVASEALARWVRPQGVVTAADFIVVAEEFGIVYDLGKSVMRAAINAMGSFPGGHLMAINASPTELAHVSFATEIERWLAEAGADPRQLVIEITEQALMRLGSTARGGLERLVDTGVKLYLDDFGTGFSSLSTLRDYPVSGIKLDMSFTRKLPAPSDSTVVRVITGLNDLAANLGLTRVAEGIETAEQAAMLTDMGWDHGQGWLYGRPAPAPLPTNSRPA